MTKLLLKTDEYSAPESAMTDDSYDYFSGEAKKWFTSVKTAYYGTSEKKWVDNTWFDNVCWGTTWRKPKEFIAITPEHRKQWKKRIGDEFQQGGWHTWSNNTNDVCAFVHEGKWHSHYAYRRPVWLQKRLELEGLEKPFVPPVAVPVTCVPSRSDRITFATATRSTGLFEGASQTVSFAENGTTLLTLNAEKTEISIPRDSNVKVQLAWRDVSEVVPPFNSVALFWSARLSHALVRRTGNSASFILESCKRFGLTHWASIDTIAAPSDIAKKLDHAAFDYAAHHPGQVVAREEAFKAGAEWQKKQASVEGGV